MDHNIAQFVLTLFTTLGYGGIVLAMAIESSSRARCSNSWARREASTSQGVQGGLTRACHAARRGRPAHRRRPSRSLCAPMRRR